MAIAPATVFQIQSTATAGNVNGGGFNPSNANFLTDGAATSATGNSPVFTSASYNFVSGDVGAWVYIKSGTNWIPGYYKISSVASNAATLSATIGQAVLVNSSNYYVTNAVAGVATTASPTAATWGIDYSQSDASRYTGSDLTGATTTCTSVTNPFTTQMVGNLINLVSGTGVTAGFYEIISVSGVTATLDRSAGTTFSLVTYNTGGAASLGSGTSPRSDSNFFALASGLSSGAGKYFIKGGSGVSYAIGISISGLGAGSTLWPIIWEGYTAIRGDRPVGSTRPTFALGTFATTLGANTDVYCLQITGTAVTMFSMGASSKIFSSKFINTSSNTTRISCSMAANTQLISNEFISYNGVAVTGPTTGGVISGCYIHDSSQGIRLGANAAVFITDNLIIANTADGINYNTAVSGAGLVLNNTVYGAENNLGIGINYSAGNTNNTVMNNIFYGLSTGVSQGSVQFIDYSNYNDYFNNTTDVSNFPKGPQDISLNPVFTNVSQITGTTATSSGSTLTVSAGGVGSLVPGQDYLLIVSGTGVTIGMYGITAVTGTTITTDNALGASTAGNIIWQVTTGRNFSVGTNVQNKGYPGSFPAGLTIGYIDMGAAQAMSGGSGGSSSFTFS